MQDTYTLKLTKHLIRHCNPEPKQYFSSIMLERGGKLVLKEPKNLEVIIKNKDFHKISED